MFIKYEIIVLFFIIIQLCINILIAEYLEIIVAKHPFFRGEKVNGTIVGMRRRRTPARYSSSIQNFVIVEYVIGDTIYRNPIVKCKEDVMGKTIFLMVNEKGKCAVRCCYEEAVRDANNVSPIVILFFLLFLLINSCVLAIKFQSIQYIGGLLVVLLFIDYFCLPLFLIVRNKTWKKNFISIN